MLDYYPHVLRSYGEIKGVADSQQWLFERLWAAAERVFENQFVEPMDDMGLRWQSAPPLQVPLSACRTYCPEAPVLPCRRRNPRPMPSGVR